MDDLGKTLSLIRKNSNKLESLSQEELKALRERFFYALGERAIRHALGKEATKGLVTEVVRLLIGIDSDISDELASKVPVGFFQQASSLGWAYQVWNAPARDDNSWAVSKKDEDQNEVVDIAAVTQIFTDEYIADFIAKSCLGLIFARPDLGGALPSICDPALGTGHIILSAIKALSARGLSADQISGKLYGYDIDPLAVIIARVAIFSELIASDFSGEPIILATQLRNALTYLEPPYGSLKREGIGSVLPNTFDCIVTNPPYLGRRKLPQAFRDFLDQEYPATSIDLSAAFLERCIELLNPEGILGVVTTDKWIRLPKYASVRCGGPGFKGLYNELAIDAIYDLGQRAFSSLVNIHDGMRAAILIGRKSTPELGHRLSFVSLSEMINRAQKVSALSLAKEELSSTGVASSVRQSELAKGGSALLAISGLPAQLVRSVRTIGDHSDVVVGIQTSNDAKYVRYVWQPPDDCTGWRVHCKGGGYGRWGGQSYWLVNWRAGEGGYLGSSALQARAEGWANQDGWVYSWLANGNLALRRKQPGWSIGRAAAGGVFPRDKRLVAFANSRIASAAVRFIGGKIQLPEGTVKACPAPFNFEAIDSELIDRAVELKERISASDLREAIFRPGEVAELEELLLCEAALLAIEGVLEEQVEQSLELADTEKRGLMARLGGVVGWYAPSLPLDQHPISNRVPLRYREHILRYSDHQPRLEGVDADLSLGVTELNLLLAPGSIQSKIRDRWFLPSTGVVETLSRVLCLHPFDTFMTLERILRSDLEFSLNLRREHLAKCLIELVLTRLGHQWWGSGSDGALARGSQAEALSYDELIDLAKELSKRHEYYHANGGEIPSLVKWIFDTWQSAFFLRNSPFLIDTESCSAKGVRLNKP